MTQTRFLIALLVLALTCGTTLRGDDPKPDAPPDPCVTDLTLERLDNPPERKTKFVQADEPHKIPLNVKLIDQKFAAIIRIELPNNRGNAFGSESNGRSFGRAGVGRSLPIFPRDPDYEEFLSLQSIRGRFFLQPNVSPDGQRYFNEGLDEAMKRMLAHIPAEHPPGKADREFFASAEVDKYVSTFAGGSRSERAFVLLAATAEEAEQRAKTLLTILDQGFSRPIQLWLFKQRQEKCQQAEEQKHKRAAADQQLKMIGEELQKYADYTPDTLPGLRVQQFQADAELAGLKAKIAAYEKILKDKERGSPLFDAKTTAEIDLLSCEARRATLVEIIGKIKLREELMEKQTAAVTTRKRAAEGIDAISQSIRRIDEDITAFGPVRLIDDQVTISPVEWVRTPEREEVGGASRQP
jgi:hypothetical protein